MRIILFFIFIINIKIFSNEVLNNEIEFKYYNLNAEKVFLVGSMNNWNTTASPMQKFDNGMWKIVLKLVPGKYSYKFIVDGEWLVDKENPIFEDDGYGGSNSIIEIDSNGIIVEKNNNMNTQKSIYNPNIFFSGQYYSNNIFLKNETDRFMLEKPEHDLNFGINVKFNSKFTGYTVFNVNNLKEGSEIWRTHFNYKRTYLKLNIDYINLIAYDNFALFTFDNPLNIIGDVGYDGYDFGYNSSGIYLETTNIFSKYFSKLIPLSVYTKMLYSDKHGADEDDISAIRLKYSFLSINQLIFGMSKYKYTNKVIDMKLYKIMTTMNLI